MTEDIGLRSSKNANPPFHVRQIPPKKAANKIRTAACQRKTENLTFFILKGRLLLLSQNH